MLSGLLRICEWPILARTEKTMTKTLAVIALMTTSALAGSPYPTPMAEGWHRIQRTQPGKAFWRTRGLEKMSSGTRSATRRQPG